MMSGGGAAALFSAAAAFGENTAHAFGLGLQMFFGGGNKWRRAAAQIKKGIKKMEDFFVFIYCNFKL